MYILNFFFLSVLLSTIYCDCSIGNYSHTPPTGFDPATFHTVELQWIALQVSRPRPPQLYLEHSWIDALSLIKKF